MKPGDEFDGRLGCHSLSRTVFQFGVFSENADRVELCLFGRDGKKERRRMPAFRTGNVHHLRVEVDASESCYGYRAYGMWEPARGHRFNPRKLLMDPYATAFEGCLERNPAIYGHLPDPELPDGDSVFNPADSSPFVPKASLPRSAFRRDPFGMLPFNGTRFLYEAHLKGFTMNFPGIPSKTRGTYSAWTFPPLIQHLLDLGVTHVEFMPLQFFASQDFQIARGLEDYWGYNTLNFFAAHPAYGKDDPAGECREMFRVLGANGIRVILDMAFNHTAESGHLGPHLSFKGLDNKAYYVPEAGGRGYRSRSGCGNELDFRHPAVRRMAMDALVYWRRVMGADGFRFDLASVLTEREKEGGPDFFEEAQALPDLSGTEWIVEPWDATLEGRKIGRFDGCSEWNDEFRDGIRRFWRGEENRLSRFAEVFCGSRSVFGVRRDGFGASVNYAASHDGFTLRDLNSFETKRNEENREDNRDGIAEEYGSNHGHEGLEAPAEVESRRIGTAKAMVASAILAVGSPMLHAGDELGNSSGGNNNAYSLDNPQGWVDWNEGSIWRSEMTACIRRAFLFRQSMESDYPESFAELEFLWKWYNPNGSPMKEAYWRQSFAKSLALVLTKARPEKKNRLYFAFNAASKPVRFYAPEGYEFGESQFETDAEKKSSHSSFEVSIPRAAFGIYDLSRTPSVASGP